MGRRAVLSIICAFIVLLTGCRGYRTVEVRSDSVRTITRTEIKMIRDTTYLDIPLQESETTTKDSLSHLENEYAISDAAILPDGSLFHKLGTKPQKKPVIFYNPVKTENTQTENIKKESKIEYKEKELTWLEKAQIYLCRVLVVFIFLYVIIKCRHKLFSLV